MTCQPKGSMCAACKNSARNCSALPFEQMQVIKTYADDTKAVKCTQFQAPEKPKKPQ